MYFKQTAVADIGVDAKPFSGLLTRVVVASGEVDCDSALQGGFGGQHGPSGRPSHRLEHVAVDEWHRKTGEKRHFKCSRHVGWFLEELKVGRDVHSFQRLVVDRPITAKLCSFEFLVVRNEKTKPLDGNLRAPRVDTDRLSLL